MPSKKSRNKKTSKNKARRRGTSARKIDPVPKGFSTVTPYLTINSSAAEALDWYKKAFGAKELERHSTPDGKIMNASIKIGDSMVMLSDNLRTDASSTTPSGVTLHIYSKNVDKLWQQAVDAGARVNMPIDNQFWGERYGQLGDPYGHNWSMSQRVAMSREEMKQKQEQAMSMFSQGEHPGSQGMSSETAEEEASAMAQD